MRMLGCLSNLAEKRCYYKALIVVLTYLSSPVCNWTIFRLAHLRRTNIIIEKSCVIENEFHVDSEQWKHTWSHHKPKQMLLFNVI